jgi:hypothetical protein
MTWPAGSAATRPMPIGFAASGWPSTDLGSRIVRA